MKTIGSEIVAMPHHRESRTASSSPAAAANAIVVPSILEESFGASTLEGLMLGKPTMAIAFPDGKHAPALDAIAAAGSIVPLASNR